MVVRPHLLSQLKIPTQDYLLGGLVLADNELSSNTVAWVDNYKK